MYFFHLGDFLDEAERSYVHYTINTEEVMLIVVSNNLILHLQKCLKMYVLLLILYLTVL